MHPVQALAGSAMGTKGSNGASKAISISIALMLSAIILPIGLKEWAGLGSLFEDGGALEDLAVIEPLLLTLVPVLVAVAIALHIVDIKSIMRKF